MKNKGFTLIELLVVIAVIGILASVILVSLNSARDKARYARVISDMREIAKASELQVTDSGMYPGDALPNVNPGLTAISTWPTPPCTGWTYDWDNWWTQYGGSYNYGAIRVTIRQRNVSPKYFYCIATNGDCGVSEAGGIDIRTAKTLSCNE